MKKGSIGLDRFVKDECSNYDKHYEKCHFAAKCKVFNGVRCGFFERNVLITDPNYKFRQEGIDYSKILAEYKIQTSAKTQNVKTHYCKCGVPIGFRKKFCNKCRDRKRKKTRRDYQRKFRKLQNVST